MTRPKGAPRTMYERPTKRNPDAEYSIQIGVVMDGRNPFDVEKAKQLTHDAVLRHAGIHRRSGVTWTFMDNDDSSLDEFLTMLEEADGRPLADVRHHLQANSHSILVIAEAEVDRHIDAGAAS